MNSRPLLWLALGVLLGAFGYHFVHRCDELPIIGEPEVVVVTDTIRVPVPVPISDGVVDKAVVPSKKQSDTVQNVERPTGGISTPTQEEKPLDDTPSVLPSGEVEIPIERKTYQTDDYKAVVEGWRPNLVSMEVYAKTTIVTTTRLQKPRFAVSVGPSVSWDGKAYKPAISLTVGYILFSK